MAQIILIIFQVFNFIKKFEEKHLCVQENFTNCRMINNPLHFCELSKCFFAMQALFNALHCVHELGLSFSFQIQLEHLKVRNKKKTKKPNLTINLLFKDIRWEIIYCL